MSSCVAYFHILLVTIQMKFFKHRFPRYALLSIYSPLSTHAHTLTNTHKLTHIKNYKIFTLKKHTMYGACSKQEKKIWQKIAKNDDVSLCWCVVRRCCHCKHFSACTIYLSPSTRTTTIFQQCKLLPLCKCLGGASISRTICRSFPKYSTPIGLSKRLWTNWAKPKIVYWKK